MILFAIFAGCIILSLVMLIFIIHSNKVIEQKERKQAQEASRLVCPDCGSEPMEPIQDYSYDRPEREEKVEGNIYHCGHCGHDEVVEKRWQLVSVTQRRYFHG